MRYFLSKSVPPFSRVLIVESGSRHLIESFLPRLYQNHPGMALDLVTCYPGAPAQFRSDRGAVYRVPDYRTPKDRSRFCSLLRANRYSTLGMICSAEPIMTKWKWMLAFRVPAKVFILNENGDYFWVDRGHWRTIRHFVLFRAGLSGAGAVRTPVRVLLFPFTLLYLILFAAAYHFRRKLRII